MKEGYLKRFREISLFDSLRFLRIVIYWNGLLPFRCSKDGKGVRACIISMIISVFHCLFFVLIFMYSIEESKYMNESFFKTEVSTIVSFIYRLSTLCSFTPIFISSLFGRKQLFQLMDFLLQTEEKFRSLSIDLKLYRITILNLFGTIGIIGFIAFYNLASMFVFRKIQQPSFLLQISFVLPIFYLWIYVLIYITFVYIIKYYLKEVNSVINLYLN